MTQSEVNKKLIKPLAVSAAIIGLVEGVVWTVFSVLAVCCYLDAIVLDVTPSQVTKYYELIYSCFLNPDGNVLILSSLYITPKEFFIFMWFYVAFSVLLIIESGTIIWGMIHDQWHLTKYLFGGWATITILSSLVDVIFVSLLGVDYDTLLSHETIEISVTIEISAVLTTYGIMMTLAVRGYILWIINVIFAIILIKAGIDIAKYENETPSFPVIHGYEDDSITPTWQKDNPRNLWGNPKPDASKMNGGYDNPGFERSQSFYPAVLSENRNNLPYSQSSNLHSNNVNNNRNSDSPTSSLQRVAKIGKQGRRSPPINIPPPNVPPYSHPHIPDPDYTPPNSPDVPKSVLRTKSSYY